MSRTHPNVKIIFGNGFPHGGASTKRCLHIANGLQENGCTAEIVVFRGTERAENTENKLTSGVFDGVKFRYMHKSTVWPTGIFNRGFNLYTGLFKTIHTLDSDNKTTPVDAILLAGHYGYIASWLISSFCRKKNIPSVLFADEYPDFMLQKGTPFRLLNALFSYFIVRKFSVLAVISEALFNFWEPMLGNWQKLLKYPLTAKESDEIAKVSSYEFDYIFYSGFSRMRLSSKYLEKDEPEVLIKAFSLVNKLHGDVRLIISGQKSDILIESVKLLGLENRVIFVGKVVEAEYNQLIKQALACILPRPKTIQSKGSMPYRLGEYLLAGRFIISSDVGEIKQFVEGDKTVLFYTPGDYFDLAKQIELVRDAKKRIGLSFKRPLMEQKLNLELNSRELANLIKGESISH